MSIKNRGFASFPKAKLKEVSSRGGSVKNPSKGTGSLPKKARSENASKASRSRWEKEKARRKGQMEQEPS